ncbi:MAG: hypothetical protein ACREA2_13110 [Blastocatellia bacterium]
MSREISRLLLAAAVRRMPAERREWGAAMLAELAQLQNPPTRWRFALGCARVALFPPRKGGLFQTIMNQKIKSIVTTLGSATLISFILVLPFAILESLNNTITRQNAPGLIALFGVMWLLPMAFIVILAPIVRTVRAGNGILANPITLLFRVAFLSVIAWMWGSLLIDQLPCFLGVPNCD